jgi:hypothetical protein
MATALISVLCVLIAGLIAGSFILALMKLDEIDDIPRYARGSNDV